MAELRVKETGTIKLFESDNTSSVTIASPASLGADRTITLPDASVTLASGTMLATDGDGSGLSGVGKMGQLLQQVYATEVTASADSGDGADSGLSLAITPAATGSKILVEINLASSFYNTGGVGYGIKIYRTISGGSASSVFDNNYHWVGVGYIGTSTVYPSGRLHTFWNYLDSPSTTLATTYNIRVYTESAGAVKFQPNTEQSTLTLTEVLA